MQRKSKRFDRGSLAARIAPLILAVLTLGLALTVALVILAALGLT